jgi:hypothetical protein
MEVHPDVLSALPLNGGHPRPRHAGFSRAGACMHVPWVTRRGLEN